MREGFGMKKRLCMLIVVSLFVIRAFPQNSEDAPPGLYVGLLSFDAEINDLTNGSLLFLDGNDLGQFNRLLNAGYKRASHAGTLLFYGVHRAMANLTANAKRYSNLDGVYLLTFTDGQDQGSTGKALPPIEGQDFHNKDKAAYQAYLREQIADREITAFSVGVRSGVDDATLSGLASSRDNVYKLRNFSELRERLKSIAENLSINRTKSVLVYIALDSSLSLQVSDAREVRIAVRQFVYTVLRRSRPELTPPDFVRIEAGSFMMGSPETEAERNDDEFQRYVTIDAPFYLSQYEVTQREWLEVMGNNPSLFKGDTLPVENVSWYDAIDYCNKRSEREGLTAAYTIAQRSDGNGTDGRGEVTWNQSADGYRLPTEAEWEYACRAGTVTPYHTGDTITPSHANYTDSALEAFPDRTWPVGSAAPNLWGLYDMSGNVSEWCWDSYAASLPDDVPIAASVTDRVHRGGSWFAYSPRLRAASRGHTAPYRRATDTGFRVILPF
jgi:formylglycine-generating enzyme required for sulfatase activity